MLSNPRKFWGMEQQNTALGHFAESILDPP